MSRLLGACVSIGILAACGGGVGDGTAGAGVRQTAAGLGSGTPSNRGCDLGKAPGELVEQPLGPLRPSAIATTRGSRTAAASGRASTATRASHTTAAAQGRSSTATQSSHAAPATRGATASAA